MINQRYKKHHQTEQKNTTRFCGLRRAKAKLHSKSRLKRLQQHRPHQAVRAAGANQIYQIDQIDYDIDEVRQLLEATPGLIVLDNLTKNEYPMPLFAKNKDEVFVGRIRRDHSAPNSLNLWIVADNLRKGAATNAVQIAEYLMAHNLVGASALAV